MSDNTEFDIDSALVELIELAQCGKQAAAIDLANKIEEAHKHAIEHCNQGEPVGVVCFDAIGDQQVTAIKWLGEYTPKQGDKIFANAMPKSDDCEKCKGSGEIGGQASYGMNEYGYETLNCPDCGGTGDRRAVAVFGGRRLTPEGTTEFYGYILNNKNNGDLHNGTVLYTTPQPSTDVSEKLRKAIAGLREIVSEYPGQFCSVHARELLDAIES